MLPPPPTSTLFPYTTLFRSVLQQLDHRHLRPLYHHPLRVQHQHVHADPLAHHREVEVAQAPDGIGLRRNQDVPRLEDGWELPGIDIFRIDQHFSRRERHEGRIDV